ncbi:MAG: creatininase family protein [Desulfurococcaceae archaeon]
MIIDLGKNISIDKDCRLRTVILPLGSLEYHGNVMPFNTDTLIATSVLNYCLIDKNDDPEKCIYITPPIPFGYSHEWLDYAGTISIEPIVYVEFIESIIKSLEYNLKPLGYVFLNSHGGNTNILQSICKKLYSVYKKPFILVDLWRIASNLGLKYCHACLFESKLLNYLTNSNYTSVNEKYCREEYLTGQYVDYKPGYCGELNIDIEFYLKTVCKSIDKAFELIMNPSK